MIKHGIHKVLAQSPGGLMYADVTDTFYASEGFIGYGAQIKVGQGDASPETFVAIPEMSVITPGDFTTGIADFTHLRSPDRHREKKGTIRDSGPISCAGAYRPGHGAHLLAGGDGFDATHNLVYLWTNVVQNNFELDYPTDAGSFVLPIRGTITKYQPGELTVENKVPFTLEITPLRAYFTGPVA